MTYTIYQAYTNYYFYDSYVCVYIYIYIYIYILEWTRRKNCDSRGLGSATFRSAEESGQLRSQVNSAPKQYLLQGLRGQVSSAVR